MIFVASYCRVSTDREDQSNSFASQQRYFQEYVSRQPGWSLYATYADEGITGTSTKKREAFNRMMADARLGKFQLILTKEVSRFSRNILDTIAYTRELRQLGIGVLFMNDAINTLDADAELRLSIMGSIAQEESRRTSSRVKWGQTRQMERGVVFGRSLLGYDVKGGSLTVNPEGAQLVRLIFRKYGVEKKGTGVIARELQEAGYRTHTGMCRWSNSHIVKILRNEKYVGDLVQKKSFTPDYLTHAKKTNWGQEPLVVLRNHHEPIIERWLWDLVQSELKRRRRRGAPEGGRSDRYLFSGKIRCGQCGAGFVSRSRKRGDGTICRRWSCRTAVREGRRRLDSQGEPVGCDIGRSLRDEAAMDMLGQALRSLRLDREALIGEALRAALETVGAGEGSRTRLEGEIHRLKKKKADALDAFLSGDMTRADMLLLKARYDRELEELAARLEPMAEPPRRAGALWEEAQERAAALLDGRAESSVFYKSILDRMVVCQDGRVEVRLNALSQTWTFLLEDCEKKPDRF